MKKAWGWSIVSLVVLVTSAVSYWSFVKPRPEAYFLVNQHFLNARCVLIDRAGKELISLPGNFCFFFPDGSYLTAVLTPEVATSGIFRFGPDTNLRWHKNLMIHHDAYLDREKSEFFLISTRIIDHKKYKSLVEEYIFAVDSHGKEIFSWYVMDHFDELNEISQRLRGTSLKAEFERDESSDDPKKGSFNFTHLNTVMPLPPNRLGEQDTRFRPGNILLNCWYTGLAFIVDRQNGKIVWAYHFPRPTHSLRMDKEGIIYFFANRQHEAGLVEKNSSVDALNPATGKRWRIFPKGGNEPVMFSKRGGSLEFSAEGNLVATSSLEGKAFEFDLEGNLIWAWTNPKKNISGEPEITYRVSPVSAEEAKRFLDNWRGL